MLNQGERHAATSARPGVVPIQLRLKSGRGEVVPPARWPSPRGLRVPATGRWMWTLDSRPSSSFVGGQLEADAVAMYKQISTTLAEAREANRLPLRLTRRVRGHRMAHSTVTALESGAQWPRLLELLGWASALDHRVQATPASRCHGPAVMPPHLVGLNRDEVWREGWSVGERRLVAARLILLDIDRARRAAFLPYSRLARLAGLWPSSVIRTFQDLNEEGTGPSTLAYPFLGEHGPSSRTVFALASSLGVILEAVPADDPW